MKMLMSANAFEVMREIVRPLVFEVYERAQTMAERREELGISDDWHPYSPGFEMLNAVLSWQDDGGR
jgi:hypothetical protein